MKTFGHPFSLGLWIAIIAGPFSFRQPVSGATVDTTKLPPPATRKIDFAKDIETLRDRVQVVEVRGVVPGPVGPAGKDGASGRDGRDGHDGIALDDLSVAVEHERTFIFRARVGGQIKDIGALTVPVDIYRGVWVEGKTYERGDGVTWAGSEWHCNDTTTVKPGDGSRDWTLKVKRGRDGKDGKDAEQPLPVVKR